MWSRSRRRVALLIVVVLAVGVSVGLVSRSGPIDGIGQFPVGRAYGPQPSRAAEWTGNRTAPLSDDQVDKIARQTTIAVIPKSAENFSITDHFADARKLMAAARAYGNPLKVFEYFSASFWFTANSAWGSYASGFSTDWYLRDAAGRPIAFYGTGRTAKKGSTPIGYMIDLRNPDFRAWAVRTVVSWMHAAPYAGIAFDSANPILPTVGVRDSVGGGDATNYSALLCGDSSATCSVVDDWNAGLRDLLDQTTKALHQIGDKVMYNGIAPSPVRDSTRNVGLLADSDIAVNEAFCFTSGGANGEVRPYDLGQDITLMSRIASEHKQVVEVTNYGPTKNQGLGSYCLGAFLMGWQPGSSTYMFHSGYHDRLSGAYPEIPEATLQLGTPTAAASTHGKMWSRTFQHGFVAVNTGSATTTMRVGTPGVRFADGQQRESLPAGAQLQVPARSAAFVLNAQYLAR